MSKPKSVAVTRPDATYDTNNRAQTNQPNEPLSGSKKVKNHNHVSHHNPQG
ncbi:MAG: small acid-soluble spore protein P [Candidatus Cohnella colombiensis]|uniref:Small acid-soluble spore protein P n=1 Tax=Candidatus Cohnella colombiensis TaxID=3121368 RepID=A0AA95JBQ0_9BACL|nr:MAG: small acid-soluble spore protein P [Cohnella sp.]